MAKILVLGSHAESLLNFRKEMLIAMAKHNTVIACVPDASQEIIIQLQDFGIYYYDVDLARTGLNPVTDLRTVWQLYKLFKKLQPDQVLAYTSKPVIFGSIAAKLAGINQIYSMITGLGSYFVYADFKSRCIRAIMVLLYKFSLSLNSKVFFQNPDDISEFKKLGILSCPERTILINGSGVNIEYFGQTELPKEQLTFLLISRFIRSKGIYEYLAAARMIKLQYPQTKFLLVGWLDQKGEALDPVLLQEYIDSGIVENLGKLQDVRPALAQASVFVLPSYREGTPRGVLEAMAAGRAIITTDVPGCRETVLDGVNGYLIPARNVMALHAAMEKFILNPSLITQMGHNSRELVVNKYDVHKVNRVILSSMDASYV